MMGNKKKILVVVDAQNDFVTGVFRSNEAIDAVSHITEKILQYHKDDIIWTQDTHNLMPYYFSRESKSFLIHCLYLSNGWCIIPQLAEYVDCNNVLLKHSFGSLKLPDIIKSLNDVSSYAKQNLEIEIVGFCTDICVVSNALILKAAFPDARIIVDEKCCAGTTPEKHEQALSVMKSCLIEVKR